MHDIIFLWSHPRSVSSAMERIMFERGDLTVLHEPFLHLYYVGDAKKRLAHFEPKPGYPTSYEGIRDMILEAAEQAPVFAKDMSYYVADYIHRDEEFVTRVRNTFLIRSPEKSIPSYYRLDTGVTLEEIGLEAQYRHFELVRRITGETPLVIDAEQMQADTESTMRFYCQALGLEFLPHALSWDQPVPAEWQFVAGWHDDMVNTSGIGDGDSNRVKRSFDLDSGPSLRRYYEHHLPYYLKMKKYRSGAT